MATGMSPMTENEQRLNDALRKIHASMSWYRSVAGQVSHADKDEALKGVAKALREVEEFIENE